MEPLESAADVATDAGRQRVARHHAVGGRRARRTTACATSSTPSAADQIAAQAAIQDQQELLAERRPAGRSATTRASRRRSSATSPSNLDQVVEINKGSEDGIEVGMAVVARGRARRQDHDAAAAGPAYVMLVTDTDYATAAKVVAGRAAGPTTDDAAAAVERPAGVGAADQRADGAAGAEHPGPRAVPPTTCRRRPAHPTSTTTTTTRPRRTSAATPASSSGRAPTSLPQVDLLDDSPAVRAHRRSATSSSRPAATSPGAAGHPDRRRHAT